MIGLISIRKSISSSFPKRKSKLRTHLFPMNCTIRFSFLEVKMAYQHCDQFPDAAFQSVFLAIFIGGDINPLPLGNRKKTSDALY